MRLKMICPRFILVNSREYYINNTKLENQYKNQVNFIHVEIFDNPAEMLGSGDASVGIESPVIDTWNFHTEPWTFTISRSGIIVGRFEGFVTAEEIEESLLRMLDAT